MSGYNKVTNLLPRRLLKTTHSRSWRRLAQQSPVHFPGNTVHPKDENNKSSKMMTFDTGTFANACKPGAKPRERVEDELPVTDTITEKVNRAERLAKEKENRRIKQAQAKQARKKQEMRKKQEQKRTEGGPQPLGKGIRGSSTGSSDKKVPRGKVRVNPVTGALETITQSNDDPNYVREGCMRIHKRYMNAAVEAGLGGGNGMYGHIGALNKELNSSRNTGRRPRDGPRGGSIHAAASSSGRHSGKGSMITTKQTRVGGTTIHSISTKTKDPTRQKLKRNPNFNRRAAGACDLGGNPVQKNMGSRTKSNIKTAIGGKTRSVKSTSSRKSTRSEPKSYGQMKGVINTIGGATSSSTQRYQAKKQNNEFNGGGSTVVQSSKPRRQSVTRTLGGGNTTGGNKKNDGMTDRERRAAFFEKKFGKK